MSAILLSEPEVAISCLWHVAHPNVSNRIKIRQEVAEICVSEIVMHYVARCIEFFMDRLLFAASKSVQKC
jgi:hypothetical protein